MANVMKGQETKYIPWKEGNENHGQISDAGQRIRRISDALR